MRLRTAILPTLVCLFVIGTVLSAQDDGSRSWEWSDGKFKREGVYQGIKDGFVLIDLGKGKEMRIPFNLLSDKDQKYVKSKIDADSDRDRKAAEDKKAGDMPEPIAIPETDEERMELIRKTHLWQKTPLDAKTLRSVANEFRARDPQRVKLALTTLALAMPTPEATDTVIDLAKQSRPIVGDDFYRTAFAKINTEWGCAKQAAEVWKQVGGPRRGLPRVQAALTRGNGLEQGKAIQALKFTFSEEGAQLLVLLIPENSIKVRGALVDMGPVAAPAVADLLASPDSDVRRTAVGILADIGTSEQLPMVRQLLTDTDGIVKIKASDAVEKIEASGR